MAMSLLLPNWLHATLLFLLLPAGDCFQTELDLCDSTCAGISASDLSYQRGVRYTYRYSTTVTTSLHGSNAGRNGLALDCVVDIDVVSECHLTMQIRNPQIKRLSPQKEHSVQHLKSLRESLERTRLKFSLRGGKVTALCLQEGEQVWALNIKRALLSMLQTSRTASKQELEKETDAYGTCTSRYERRGPVLLKTRNLKECQKSRLANFWPHSVVLNEDTSMQSEVHCVQRHDSAVMQEVNCTEAVSMATWSGSAGVMKTRTVSFLVLLRAQPGNPPAEDAAGVSVPTGLQFEDRAAAGPGKAGASTPQQAGQSIRKLCGLISDPRLVSEEFLRLVFLLRDLTLSQLRTLWQEASFKCRNDWQPLLDALPACGSENCISLLSELTRNQELEGEQAHAFLTTVALVPHPSPQIIDSISILLDVPEVRSKALLSGSSLVYQLCQRSQASCSELPQIQTFIRTLEETLKEGSNTQGHALLYALKSVGNIGLAAPGFIPLLNRFMLDRLSQLELRLAAIHAFRRFPCSADRSVLLQLYRSSREDPEVRIAAYQQVVRCPDMDVYEVVKMTLRNETSSQVGSYVWSHLTSVLRSEDPSKQALIESLPDDIISRNFEAEFLKYSSYSDYTVASGMGTTNVETSTVFSPKSFLPRSASANLTVYFHGRAHNLLEVDLRVENAEPLLRNLFGHQSHTSNGESGAPSQKHVQSGRTRRKTDENHRAETEKCLSSTSNFLEQARAMVSGSRRTDDARPKCLASVKVFGNELSVFTCEDLYSQIEQLSLSVAGLAVKLLKGHEVQLNHRAVLMTDELVLPSLSGLPFKLGVNMTSLLSLRLKGNAKYRDAAHFSLTGYVKPSAYVALSARMGVDGALGQAAVDWITELRSATSLDGSVHLQEGRDLRVTLNTLEDVMDVISVSSRVFQLSGDHREEIRGPKSRVQRSSCTPKTWSKAVGWQLCSNTSYPFPASGFSLPPPGPVDLSLRLLKLDRGLHHYLLEAAYSWQAQRGTWLPREASIHLLLATPQSTIPRDMSLDLNFNPQRLLLRITHPLKTILVQGQLVQERNIKSGKVELMIDGVHYYVLGLVDTQTFPSEQRTRYHIEAKMAADGNPVVLSANVTRGLGGKTSFAATVKNVFKETASTSVVLERRRDGSSRQYAVEAELLLPGVIGTRMLGLMEQRGSLWSSALRLKYGVGGDARHLRQECSTSQRVRRERDSNLTYIMRADHEFHCSNTAPINHKVHLRHEESPSHIKSSLDMSYGKHWDEINNKRTLLLSQSFKNQSTHNNTSYTLEFNLQVPEKNLNYRTQLLHSHLRQLGSESSTHLKINYNNLIPLVAGLHWKSPPKDTLQKKWEGTFNMDTPWLYIYTAHKLSQPQPHTLQLTSELTASKWLNIHNLLLEAFYRDRGREKEARLKLYTPAITYIQAGGWGILGKHGVKGSAAMTSLWTPPVGGDVSLEASKSSQALHISTTCGQHNVSITAALSIVAEDLKKRHAMLKITLSKPKSPATEVELQGVIEELRRDKKMYQKTAMVQLRQPFQNFPQTLLLRETFTVDLHRGLYILESRAAFSGNGEVIHTLTLGYRPPSPFVCSALIHPFRSETVPSDSEVCLTVTSNQTQRDIRGRLRIGSKERLTFFGQVQFNPLHSSHQEVKVRGNFSHQLELQLPSSALVEGNVYWSPKNNTDFDYQAKGRLRVERQECQLSVQLNGTSGRVSLRSSLRHPFKSKLPKVLEIQAGADVSSVPGRGSGSVCVRADGKDRVKLDAQTSHSLQSGHRAVGLTVNVSQSLLGPATDLHMNMAANMSLENVSLHGFYKQGHEVLLAQVKGSLKNTQGLQLAVSGDMRHSMASLAFLPPVLGLDATLGQSDALVEGQMRVRVLETLYSMELRHHEDPAESSNETGGKVHATSDWLCAWLGSEHLCVNVSCRFEDSGSGQVQSRLSHSFRLLNATGVPPGSLAEVGWARDGSQLSVRAELQAGPEHLKAEFNGGQSGDGVNPRWEYTSRLQHQVKALLYRGFPSSTEARTHYQLETEGLNAALVLHMDDKRMIDALFNVGSKNGTALLVMSLWQQVKLLQGLIPGSLQMNCTGDAAADRLSAQCYGNVAGHPVEVRVFRSHRPHSRRCFGVSVTHASLSAQAKGCYGSDGQRELRANFSHSSVPLLTYLGVPSKSSLRLQLRPGPQRRALGIRLFVGPWGMDLNTGLRLERPGLYGWYGLLNTGTQGFTRRAEIRGRIKFDSWCHIWADVSVALDSVTLTLLASVRCKGFGRLVWLNVRSAEQGVDQKTSLTLSGQVGTDGVKGSLGLENELDSLQCILSVLMKGRKVEFGWTLQHQWASLASIIPNKLGLQGSGQLTDALLSGTARVSLNGHSAQINITADPESFANLRVSLKQNLVPTSPPGELTLSMSTTASQADLEVHMDECAVRLLAKQQRAGVDGKTSWEIFAQQRCVLLKSLLPTQTSANISVTRSGCSTHLSAVLQAEGEQRGGLMLHLTCQPNLILKASVQHSIEAVKTLGFPTRGGITLNVSTAHVPGVEVDLELGRCFFRGRLGKTKSPQRGEERSSYVVNVTNFCPTLQGTVLPESLALQLLLSVIPGHLTVSSSLRADDRHLLLELSQSSRARHISGALTHSFPGLSGRGVPQVITVEATAPRGQEQAGLLSVRAGTCFIRANRFTETKGGQWLWALDSKCPLMQARLNGSVFRDPHSVWTAVVDAEAEGRRALLRLSARAWPELSVEGELSHDLPALKLLPQHGRLRATSRAGKQRYDAEALVQMDDCSVGASGVVESQRGLQGSLVYHNNCSLVQEWGSPDRVHSSGFIVVTPASAQSQLSVAIDDKDLQASTAFRTTKDKYEGLFQLNHTAPLLRRLGLPANAALTVSSASHADGSRSYFMNSSSGSQKISQEMTVTKTPETAGVKGHFRHTVTSLKKLGVPANVSLQVEIASPEGKDLTLELQFGSQAGVTLRVKCLPVNKEVRGAMWHSWSWLRDAGMPWNMEGLCSIRGVFPQLQSGAQLVADGHKLLASGLNVSVSDGRLALLLSISPPASNETAARSGLSTTLAAQFKGPLRSISADVHCPEWRVQVMGDVGGWAAYAGAKEARVTLKHSRQGQTSPALQVEAWGRLTESQLRCSLAVNPELSSSLALILQGHHLPHSKDLMVKVVQNIPTMLVHLPPQLSVCSQLNQSRSGVAGLVEVSSGRKRLWALGELTAMESGYRQAVELKHSYPQLKPLPRTVAARTLYEARNWSYQLQHAAVWGSQELSLSGLYSAPPTLEMGNNTLKVQISCVPRRTSLDVTMDRFSSGRLDSVSLGWMRHGRLEQVKALSSWSRSEELNETKLEVKQPFSSTLGQMSLHTLSHSSPREQRSSQQTSLSWSGAAPVNISLNLNKQWQNNSSRGQACALFSAQQMSVSSVKGCVSVGQEGSSYSQNAELRWENKSIKQGMKYQRGLQGMHSFQVTVGLDRVSPAPCPSHTILAKIQTNLRDRLEHTVLLGLCPPKPALSWSGSHRVNAGEELFYTQSRLAVAGRPQLCSLTITLSNSSTARSSNVSLFSESRMGNWSVEVGGSATSWPRGSGLLMQVRLDRREKIWLNGTLEGCCLQSTAGYVNGSGTDEDITVVTCMGTNRSFTLDVQKRAGGGRKAETLGSLSVESANQRLTLRAHGCLDGLTELEAHVHHLGSQIQTKLLERIRTLQRLLLEFRRQSRDSEWLQELSAVSLQVSQRAEALLGHKEGGLLAPWQNGPLRRFVTDSLPRFLGLLQHASLLGQQELRRPLATLAGVYQDVKGQRPEAVWREAVSLWTEWFGGVLPALLGNPQLRPLAQASLSTLSIAVDAAGQHTYQWLEARLATSLSGIRKRLASVYKYSPSKCSVSVSVPLPPLPWSRVAEAGVVEVLLEEWLLRPLQTLAAIRPMAELYRLKRNIMDSPFRHQALLVSDQFAVTFDGHLYELPGSCPLLLAQDVGADPSFTLLLNPDSRSFLKLRLSNSTVDVQKDGQVKANCNSTVTNTFHGGNGVAVRVRSRTVQVSSQNGVTLSCDLSQELCSFTLDGLLHGASAGLLGTNDNEAGNDSPLPDGSQAQNLDSLLNSWQVGQKKADCMKPPGVKRPHPKAATTPVSCGFLFSSADSPLSSCFRVVDPARFWYMCELSSSRAPCRLAYAFIHLCQQNYIPLEVPTKCLKL